MDVARSVRLLRAFRHEQSDPAGFYELLARDTADRIVEFAALDGALVLDVGCADGYFLREAARRGARAAGVDLDKRAGMIIADARALPFASGSVDVCFSSNVLEHVRDPWRMAAEMVRVTRPGGLVYLAFTNWLSPWGGHETSPWHLLLGGRGAARRYAGRHGRPPKNHYGRTLFPVSVRAALAWADAHPAVSVVAARPRYHPRWAHWVVRVPGLREVATWNLALALRKH